MTLSRRTASLAMGLLAAALLAAPRAIAQSNANAAGHAALLIDLPGWEGGERQTMAFAQGAVSYLWASREYTRDDARLTVILGLNPAAPPDAAAGSGQDMEMRSGPNLMRMRTVRGMRVMSTFNADDKTGGMVIYLTPSGAGGSLVVQFEGMTLDDAAALANRFDWPAMQRQVVAK